MVTLNKKLSNCTGFEWEQGNITKNWEKHDVSTGECEQIFFNKPIIVQRDKVQRDKKHSEFENRYYALGKTDVNRLLFLVFTIRNDKIRTISARDMTESEIERYLK